MAEGAIDTDAFLPVAIDAAAHRDIALFGQNVTGGDWPMALAAIQIRFQVRAVTEAESATAALPR